jgi:arylsulfatase A-like enzyme
VVGLVDLGPTLLQLLGIEERPRSWQGLDLFSKKRRVGVFSQRYDEVAITLDGRMKAIARSAPTGSSLRFFDLGSDPAEQSALDDPRQRTSLEQLYADWLAITPRVQRNPDEKPVDVCGVLPEGLQGEWMERLRELGYVE